MTPLPPNTTGAYPTQKVVRAFNNGDQQLAAEFDPFYICVPTAGTKRIVFGMWTLDKPRQVIIPWPEDKSSSDGMTTFEDESINALIRSHIRLNIQTLHAPPTDLALDPFPRGDRVAIIGKGPTAAAWNSGDPLPLPEKFKAWAPNLAIYCNHAGATQRALASRSAQNWIAVIDRDVTMAEMDKAFDGADGLILSIGVKPELFFDARRRGIPVHVMAPHHYRETILDGHPELADVVTFCAHTGGVASTVANALYMNRKAGSVLLTGVDGAYPLPATDDPDAERQRTRAYIYNDMAAVMAVTGGMLEARGLTVFDTCRQLPSGEITPFGWAVAAIRRWDAKERASRLAGTAAANDRLADEVAKLPKAFADAGIKVAVPEGAADGDSQG